MSRAISEEPVHLQHLLGILSEAAFSRVIESKQGKRSLDVLCGERLAVELGVAQENDYCSFYGTLARITEDELIFEDVNFVSFAGNITGSFRLESEALKYCKTEDIKHIYLAKEFAP